MLIKDFKVGQRITSIYKFRHRCIYNILEIKKDGLVLDYAWRRCQDKIFLYYYQCYDFKILINQERVEC